MRNARCIRSAIALVVLLNALGSPMAWAHLLGTGAHGHAGASEMAPGCHGDGVPSPDHSEPGSSPCCDAGSCTCAAAALSVLVGAQAARVPHPPFSTPFGASALPARPLDDTLRPPIR